MAAKAESDANHDKVEYTDYVLLGKTGMGKSTTGNKLLGVYDNNNTYKLTVHRSKIPGLLKPAESSSYAVQFRSRVSSVVSSMSLQESQVDLYGDKAMFKVGQLGDVESTTDTCQLISNDKLKIRVLDIPGFADTGHAGSGNVYSNNLALIRQLVRIQMEKNLKIWGLLYFLPERGVMEKATGVLQEEIDVLHHFFGMEVFQHMVVVATNPPARRQRKSPPIGKEDIEDIKMVFTTAVEKVVGDDFCKFECPPVIYIDQDDSGTCIQDSIFKVVKNKFDKRLELEIRGDVCSKCGMMMMFYAEGKKERVSVFESKEKQRINYCQSKCHPFFIPRHLKLTKIIGGTLYLLAKAAQAFIGAAEPALSSFFLFGEECINCGGKPGDPGCLCVSQKHEFIIKHNGNKKVEWFVDHSSELNLEKEVIDSEEVPMNAQE